MTIDQSVETGRNDGSSERASGGTGGDYALAGPAQRILRSWWLPLAVALAAAVLLSRFDGAIDQFKWSAWMRGDVRRELEALQQFGQGTFSVLIGLVILLLDPAKRRWLLAWALTAAILGPIVTGLKMILGRARPRLTEPYDPLLFLGPFGRYPWTNRQGSIEMLGPMEFWKRGVSDLWSMPSSHTAFAVLAAYILAHAYPRIRWVMWPLAAVVGLCRLVFDAHYLTDVIVGACVALTVCRLVVPKVVAHPLTNPQSTA